MRKQVFSFTMEPELEQYVRKMAELAHVTIGQYIRNVLWDGYESNKYMEEERSIEDYPQCIQEMIKKGEIKF